MNKAKYRKAYISSSETTKANGVRTKIELNITIDRVLPIVLFKDALVTKHIIVSTPHTMIPDANVYNTISKDNNGVERYDYIGYAVSAITKCSVRMYYDNVIKDVIVIPDTELLVVDETLQSGKVYTISGFALGSTARNVNVDMFSNLASEINSGDKNELPKFNNNISTIKSHVMMLHGVGYNNSVGGHTLGLMITSGVYLERNSTDKTMLVELGDVTSTLVNTNDTLPCYNLLQHTVSQNTGEFIGNKVVPVGVKIGYVLDF